MATESLPLPRLEVPCPHCGKKIADYIGPIGYQTPVLSRYFVRANGTRPTHGSSTAGTCPSCHKQVNELDCTLFAIASALAKQTAAEVLAEAPDATPKAYPVEVAATEHEDDSSDCSS